jgi:hypothetical protein
MNKISDSSRQHSGQFLIGNDRIRVSAFCNACISNEESGVPGSDFKTVRTVVKINIEQKFPWDMKHAISQGKNPRQFGSNSVSCQTSGTD